MGSELGNWLVEEIPLKESGRGVRKKSSSLSLPFLTAVRGKRTKQKMVTELILGVRAEFPPFCWGNLLVSKNSNGPIFRGQARRKLVNQCLLNATGLIPFASPVLVFLRQNSPFLLCLGVTCKGWLSVEVKSWFGCFHYVWGTLYQVRPLSTCLNWLARPLSTCPRLRIIVQKSGAGAAKYKCLHLWARCLIYPAISVLPEPEYGTRSEPLKLSGKTEKCCNVFPLADQIQVWFLQLCCRPVTEAKQQQLLTATLFPVAQRALHNFSSLNSNTICSLCHSAHFLTVFCQYCYLWDVWKSWLTVLAV